MELEFLDWLRTQLSDPQGLAQNWQNDAAVLSPPSGKQLVVTTDTIVDGTHFDSSIHSLESIGRKALAVNLSDIAAMAAAPSAAFVSIVLPRRAVATLPAHEAIRRVYDGIIPLANDFNTTIAGGDTNMASAPLTIAITLLGYVEAGRAWRRDGARPGDAIYVTGPLGGSIAGHHLSFTPRVREALAIDAKCDVHAGMDISDGLSLDLWRICQASGVGAEIDAAAIPTSDAARALSLQDGRTALEHALHDGEDFELLIVGPPEQLDQMKLTRIGRCIAGQEMLMVRDGAVENLLPGGYEHR
jgi:thiamine-monophosphate kinase